MTSTAIPHVTQNDIADFADNTVNLKREAARKYRDQVAGVIENVHGFIKDHPDYGLIKMLRSGSLAKGTALSTLISSSSSAPQSGSSRAPSSTLNHCVLTD